MSLGHLGYAMPGSSCSHNTITGFDEKTPEIIKVIPFNGTIPSSITVDHLSNLLYVPVNPDYYYKYLSQSCSGESNVTSKNLSDSSSTCSVTYVLDGKTDQIIDVIRLGPGEKVHDLAIDPRAGKIYATGEYNYRADDSEGNGEEIQYEYEFDYTISGINYTNSNKDSASASINTERIILYGEIHEGKEGDMSDVAVDTNTNANVNTKTITIYAGIRYYQGSREGIFIIPDVDQIDSKLSGANNRSNLSMQ